MAIKKDAIKLFFALSYLIAVFFISEWGEESLMQVALTGIALFFGYLTSLVEDLWRKHNRKKETKQVVKKIDKWLNRISDKKIDVEPEVQRLLRALPKFSKFAVILNTLRSLHPQDEVASDAFVITFLVSLSDSRFMDMKPIEYFELSPSEIKQIKEAIGEILQKKVINQSDFTELRTALDRNLDFLVQRLDVEATGLDHSYLYERYAPLGTLAMKFSLNGEQAEFARKKLATLIKDGRLNKSLFIPNEKKLVANKAGMVERIPQDCFLIHLNKLQKTGPIITLLENNVSFSLGLHIIEGAKFSRKLLFLEQGVWTEKRIIDELIKPHFSGHDVNGFLSIQKIGNSKPRFFPLEESSDWNKNLKFGYKALKQEIRSSVIEENEDDNEFITPTIEQIIACLPFNIFFDGVKKSITDFVDDKYEVLKLHFNIGKMSDWASINASDLANKLIELDKANKAIEIKKDPTSRRIAGDKKWNDLATDVISKVKQHQNALDI